MVAGRRKIHGAEEFCGKWDVQYFLKVIIRDILQQCVSGTQFNEQHVFASNYKLVSSLTIYKCKSKPLLETICLRIPFFFICRGIIFLKAMQNGILLLLPDNVIAVDYQAWHNIVFVVKFAFCTGNCTANIVGIINQSIRIVSLTNIWWPLRHSLRIYGLVIGKGLVFLLPVPLIKHNWHSSEEGKHGANNIFRLGGIIIPENYKRIMRNQLELLLWVPKLSPRFNCRY